MHFVGVYFRTEGRVNALMSLNGSLALEFGRNDSGVPVPAIAFERDVLTRQAGLND